MAVCEGHKTAPLGAFPDCFRRINVTRRLPFVNSASKEHTVCSKKDRNDPTAQHCALFSYRFGFRELDL